MLKSWITFAPLEPHWVLPTDVSLPYYFSECVSLQKLPEWVRQDSEEDALRKHLRAQIDDGFHHCIAVEYKADSPDMPDPNWKGDPPWSMQDNAAQLARLAHLTLWLVRPTSLTFGMVADAEQQGPEWITRNITPYSQVYPMPESSHEEHTGADLETARALFQALQSATLNGPLQIAALITTKALIDLTWEIRFLLMWLVMECLFGPKDGREISFRISQRVALFLEKDEAKARELFEQVKESYRWRSKIVHGFRLEKLMDEKSRSLLQDLERLVRRSLGAILGDKGFLGIFDGKKREGFLDGLAFR